MKRVSEDFAHSQRRADVTIYNMHGDRTNPSTAVLTKEDFESYNETRELFTVALKGDLTQKTFLFIGISFDDPNVMDILSRVKQLLAGNSREHYCLLKPPTDDGTPDGAYRVKRFSHWLKDLQRYHVQPVLIDDFNEIPTILAELNRRSHLRDVFISGSAADFSPLGEARFKELCHRLGSALIEKNFNIISGFGLGVGDMVISGAMQALGRNRDDRLQLWPFPQTVTGDRAAFWRDYRTRMISEAGVCIVLSGNKQDGSVIVPANGVREEIEIAQSLGKSVIPIGATGFVALEHWQNLKVNSAPYLGSANCSEAMDVLGNSASTTEQLVNALLDVLKTLDK